jgi:AAA15 family ATPase/GTPase
MKIKYLIIKNYKQFKDLSLELTYPKGHKKEGEPLDKICIIGQSGTGKSNLLEVIRSQHNDDQVKIIFIQDNNGDNEKIYFFDTNTISCSVSKKSLDNEKIANTDKSMIESLVQYREMVEKSGIKMYDLDALSKNIQDTDTNSLNKSKEKIISKNIINISEDNFWELLKERINSYKDDRLSYMDRCSNKLLTLDNYTKDDFKREVAQWESENGNILEKISEQLNTILKKFNLELIKIDENQQTYNALTIKDLSNENIIAYDTLSTGTKNLIATFLPLKIHNPKDSIILIDEPENSFYHDVQRKLTELYMEVGENNQLIMATHSLMIASNFEPWEVVELKFDQNNQIYRVQYYEGENHIDHYRKDPRLLTWMGILTNIFDLKEDSNVDILWLSKALEDRVSI